MPDVHVPILDEHDDEAPTTQAVVHGARGRSFLRVGLEVLLISTGVFLGLLGEQWRESAHHRALAEESLRRFQTEIRANRDAVKAVLEYHATTRTKVEQYLAAERTTRRSNELEIKGIQPVGFEHTAWDVAMATQSLTYLDSQLAFSLARAYDRQQRYMELTRGVFQAMYLRPPTENLDAFLAVLALYYDDIVLEEPALLRIYDDLLPQIDRALAR